MAIVQSKDNLHERKLQGPREYLGRLYRVLLVMLVALAISGSVSLVASHEAEADQLYYYIGNDWCRYEYWVYSWGGSQVPYVVGCYWTSGGTWFYRVYKTTDPNYGYDLYLASNGYWYRHNQWLVRRIDAQANVVINLAGLTRSVAY